MTARKHIISIGECMMELRHRDEENLTLGFGGDTLNTAPVTWTSSSPA